jgi:hypothetical protein
MKNYNETQTEGATMPPTIEEFEKWSRDNAVLALAVCEAQAAAEATKARVAAYIQPIFDSFNFVCEGKMAERFDASPRKGDTEKYVGRRITSPDSSEFTMLHGAEESEEIKTKLRAYYAACDAEHRRQGYKDLPEGHCPALRLENLHTQAENALIESAKPLFDIDQVYGEDRKRYLKLLMGTCIKALGEIQKECELESQHTTTEPSPLNPHQLRCANCFINVDRKAA